MKRKHSVAWKKKKTFKRPRSEFGNSKPSSNLSLQPPRFRAQPIFSEKIRYIVSSSGILNGTMTIGVAGQLFGLVVNGTTGTTSAYRNQSWQLKAVRLWSPPSISSGVPIVAEAELNYALTGGADSTAPNIGSNGISMDSSRPAFAQLITRPDQVPGMWHPGAGNATGLLTLTCSAGSVLDFDYNFILATDQIPVAGPAITGGTAGMLFYKTITIGSATLTPVGVSTF